MFLVFLLEYLEPAKDDRITNTPRQKSVSVRVYIKRIETTVTAMNVFLIESGSQ